MNNKLQGKVALVTGAGRGLGEIMARGLAESGVAVALVARSQAQLSAVCADIVAAGGKAITLTADVTQRAEVEAAVVAAEAELGPLDILINNAGVDDPFGPVGVVDPDQWWQTQAVHVLGPMYFMTAAIPGMSERGRGCIINICSLAGTLVQPNMSAYAVGKASEIRLTQHVAEEWAERGIAAFAIEPGTILTSMAEHTLSNPDAQKWVPGGIEFLKSISNEQSEASKIRLVEMIRQLAGGDFDSLSGRYLEPGDDFVTMLEAASSRSE